MPAYDLCRHCINWPHLNARSAPWCGRWNCPLPWHGWPVRLKACLKHIHSLTPGDFYFTLPICLNRRLHGSHLGPLIRTLRRTTLRLWPDSHAYAFPHVRHSCPHGRSPVPDIHLLLASPGPPAKGRLESAVQDFTKTMTRRCPSADVGEWEPVRCIEAMLRYLYRAEVCHKAMPADQLPRSGDYYRQVYGRPTARLESTAQFAH